MPSTHGSNVWTGHFGRLLLDERAEKPAADGLLINALSQWHQSVLAGDCPLSERLSWGDRSANVRLAGLH